MRDIIMMLLATLLMMALMLHGNISQMGGGIMLLVLLSYIVWQYVMASKGKIEVEEIDAPDYKKFGTREYLFLLLGLVGIAAGAEFLVRGAKVSASIIGVPEAVIGLSVIAIGTSLPELINMRYCGNEKTV